MTASTITDRVAEMHAAMAGKPPDEVMGAFGRGQAALAAAGAPSGVASAGTRLADVGLLDVHGAPTSLYTALGDGTAVVVFYRGVWCPYCNIALSVYQQHLLPELTEFVTSITVGSTPYSFALVRRPPGRRGIFFVGRR